MLFRRLIEKSFLSDFPNGSSPFMYFYLCWICLFPIRNWLFPGQPQGRNLIIFCRVLPRYYRSSRTFKIQFVARNVRPTTTNEFTSKIKIQLTTIFTNLTPLKLAKMFPASLGEHKNHPLSKTWPCFLCPIRRENLAQGICCNRLWLVMYDQKRARWCLSHQAMVAIRWSRTTTNKYRNMELRHSILHCLNFLFDFFFWGWLAKQQQQRGLKRTMAMVWLERLWYQIDVRRSESNSYKGE